MYICCVRQASYVTNALLPGHRSLHKHNVALPPSAGLSAARLGEKEVSMCGRTLQKQLRPSTHITTSTTAVCMKCMPTRGVYFSLPVVFHIIHKLIHLFNPNPIFWFYL